MEQMVNVFIMGKQYKVPASLTIMKAFEYAGYKLIRGCGCRNRFLWCLCNRLPHQRGQRTEGMSGMFHTGGRGYDV